MLTLPCESREVVDSFLLADTMKSGPYDGFGFGNRLGVERMRFSSMSDTILNEHIADLYRRCRYSGAEWQLAAVELGRVDNSKPLIN